MQFRVTIGVPLRNGGQGRPAGLRHRCTRRAIQTQLAARLVAVATRHVEVQEAPQEVAGPLVMGIVQDLLWRTLLDQLALVHEDDAVGRLAREVHLVGDHDHGRALVRQVLHDLEDLADELGSRALVGSSKSRTFGSMHSARAIAARCFWPPESRAGILVALLDAAPTLQESLGARDRLRPGDAASTRIGASMQLPRTVMCGKRVNSWNSIAGAQANLADLLLVPAGSRACSGSRVDPQPVDLDEPTVGSSRKLRQRRRVVLPLPDGR